MANFNKAFNFRGGFQVDEDTFLVRGRNVGIGSSVPSERLDVDGIIKARGLIVDSSEVVAITTAYVGVISAKVVQAGIFTGTPENSGMATYYGDGSQLLKIPTSQWVNVDVGLGFTSIYAAGNVGVDTTDPRYTFQVGGVPFATGTLPFVGLQPGVGIEDGNIYFSGVASARFDPNLPEVQQQGFVGYGSFLTSLNASELTSGSIPSYSYGDLIITEEVIAPILTGTATTARGITTDAQLTFEEATVLGDISAGGKLTVGLGVSIGNGIDAGGGIAVGGGITAGGRVAVGGGITAAGGLGVGGGIVANNGIDVGGGIAVGGGVTAGGDAEIAGRVRSSGFISTEGYLQIGIDDDVADKGDIEVVKTTGDNANIYAISSDQRSEILVGKERPGGSNRQFGGLRRGSTPLDPLTTDTDLDLVNYDVGNLNYYLHSGSGGTGATNGSFRWIYGQSDVVLMELDKDGTLTLPINSVVTGPLFSVGGKTELLGDVTIDGELEVADATTFSGDVTIDGELSISQLSIVGVVTFPSIDTDILRVGPEPSLGGTLIQQDSADIAGVVQVSKTSNTLTVVGEVDATSVDTNSADVNTLIVGDSISGPGPFGVNNLGQISASTIGITGGANFVGVVTFGNIVTNDITSPNASIDLLISNEVQVTTLTATDANVSGTFNTGSVSTNDVNTLSLTSVAATFSSAQVTNDISIGGRILDTGSGSVNLQTTIEGASVGVITGAKELHSNGPVRSQIGKYSTAAGELIEFVWQPGGVGVNTAIVLTAYDLEGQALATAEIIAIPAP